MWGNDVIEYYFQHTLTNNMYKQINAHSADHREPYDFSKNDRGQRLTTADSW